VAVDSGEAGTRASAEGSELTVPATSASPLARVPAQALDVAAIRRDFPILSRQVNGKPLVYLDNAATGQRPLAVIEAVRRSMAEENANIHRGVHYLSEVATLEYDAVREDAREFLNAPASHEVIFVRGTTEGINLVAQSYGRSTLRPGDDILLTTMEHHSNIVPWQIVAGQTGAVVRAIPITDAGEVDLDAYRKLLSPRTRIVGVVHISNALGTINPVAEMTRLAHEVGAVVVVDGAQAAPHMAVDVQALGCDFYACSSHKMFGPTGVGMLWGRSTLLESMPPWQGGGDMIHTVSFSGTTFAPLPAKFEAGTPAIAEVIGLGAAIRYLRGVGFDAIGAWEHELLIRATEAVRQVPGIRLVGTAREKAGVLAFTLAGVHPHDLGTILDADGVAIRAGHHCAQPVMERFGVHATARASFAFYNTLEEIDVLVRGLHRAREVFA
jgi:cysteine desulfurase/selenocysteine lyase